MRDGTKDEEEEEDGGDGDIDWNGGQAAEAGSSGRIRWSRRLPTHGWSFRGGGLVGG